MLFEWIKRNRLDILIFIAIFCLAFSVRTLTAPKFPNIYGFDSIKEAKMTRFLLENGWNYPFIDNTTDYCDYENYPDFCIKTGFPPSGREYWPHFIGWWVFQGGIYKLIASIYGIPGWDFTLFGKVASWLNAIVGSLAPAFLFLFIRKIFSREAGVIAGIFLVFFVPNLSYSMYGHAENDATGFMLFFASLWLFSEVIEKKNWKLLILFGLALFWNAAVWQSYSVGVTMMCFYIFLTTLISVWRKKNISWNIYVLGIIALTGIVWDVFFDYHTQFGSVLAVYTLIVVSAYTWIISRLRNKEHILSRNAFIAGILALIIAGGTIGSYELLKPLYKFDILKAPPRNETIAEYRKIVYETIAEQQPVGGPYSSFFKRIEVLANSYGHGYAINITLWTVFILTALFGIAFFADENFFKKFNHYTWYIIISAVIGYSLVSLTSKPISMFFLTEIEGIGVGAFFGSLIEFSKKAKREWIKPAIFLTGLLLTVPNIFPMILQAANISYDVPKEWFQTFEFLKTVPKGSIITAWWDYGHWLTYFTGNWIKVNVDNIQDRADLIHQIAVAFTQTPCDVNGLSYTCDLTKLNESEVKALKLLKPLGTDYILIDKEIVLGKYNAIEHIAGNYIGCFQAVKLRDLGNGTYYTGLSTANKPLLITQEEWEQILNSTAPEGYLLKGQLRVFGKEDTTGKYLYIPSWYRTDNLERIYCDKLTGDSPVIYSFSNRIFFHDKTLKYVEPVFDNGWIVIYKVNWNKFCEEHDCKNLGY